MSENIINKDLETSNLTKPIDILKNCQKDKGLNSCFVCDEKIWTNCKIRINYINDVYYQMSGGQNGDFDF